MDDFGQKEKEDGRPSKRLGSFETVIALDGNSLVIDFRKK